MSLKIRRDINHTSSELNRYISDSPPCVGFHTLLDVVSRLVSFLFACQAVSFARSSNKKENAHWVDAKVNLIPELSAVPICLCGIMVEHKFGEF